MPFRYLRPATLEEALDLLASGDGDTKALAGGQSLIPMISLGLARPAALIDLNALAGLDYARVEDGTLAVGPLTRHRALEHAGPELARAAPLLPAAASLIGHAA